MTWSVLAGCVVVTSGGIDKVVSVAVNVDAGRMDNSVVVSRGRVETMVDAGWMESSVVVARGSVNVAVVKYVVVSCGWMLV